MSSLGVADSERGKMGGKPGGSHGAQGWLGGKGKREAEFSSAALRSSGMARGSAVATAAKAARRGTRKSILMDFAGWLV